MRVRHGWAIFLAAVLAVAVATAQQPASPALPVTDVHADFLRAADEVLAEVSRIVALPVTEPLKKSLRTRDEVREFLLARLAEDDEPEKRYADQRVLEKFGLLPKGFDLEGFLVELLTEQIAGYYDPKAREFYVVDWQDGEEDRGVMAHELVHALQDQHFGIETWLKAARPNDDAHLARDAVLEGSALAAMVDYLLREQNLSVRDLPDVGPLLEHSMLSGVGDSPKFSEAPPYLRDALMFPYLAGTAFAQAVLRAEGGWETFHRRVFENPPASTQQVLQPELYLSGYLPEPVTLPEFDGLLPAEWKKLDENLVGQFGLHAILKQQIGRLRAERLAPAWAGDRYAVFEHTTTGRVLLVFLLRLADEESALSFFGQYSEALETKYESPGELFRRSNFFSFQTEDGPVFLYCRGTECLSVEGAPRADFDRIVGALGWREAPRPRARRRPSTVALLPAAFQPAP